MNDEIRFDFGKHYGRPVSRVPTGYLKWAYATCWNLERELREAIAQELLKRGEELPTPDNTRGSASRNAYANASDRRETLLKLVSEWYRSQALKYHPDRGGSEAEMNAINNAADDLKNRIERAQLL